MKRPELLVALIISGRWTAGIPNFQVVGSSILEQGLPRFCDARRRHDAIPRYSGLRLESRNGGKSKNKGPLCRL